METTTPEPNSSPIEPIQSPDSITTTPLPVSPIAPAPVPTPTPPTPPVIPTPSGLAEKFQNNKKYLVSGLVLLGVIAIGVVVYALFFNNAPAPVPPPIDDSLKTTILPPGTPKPVTETPPPADLTPPADATPPAEDAQIPPPDSEDTDLETVPDLGNSDLPDTPPPDSPTDTPTDLIPR